MGLGLIKNEGCGHRRVGREIFGEDFEEEKKLLEHLAIGIKRKEEGVKTSLIEFWGLVVCVEVISRHM